jgi:hypothetical protein
VKGWLENVSGRQPEPTKGKRVVVQLRSGKVAGRESVNGTSPPGWAADQARWTLDARAEDAPFDIVRFMIL